MPSETFQFKDWFARPVECTTDWQPVLPIRISKIVSKHNVALWSLPTIFELIDAIGVQEIIVVEGAQKTREVNLSYEILFASDFQLPGSSNNPTAQNRTETFINALIRDFTGGHPPRITRILHQLSVRFPLIASELSKYANPSFSFDFDLEKTHQESGRQIYSYRLTLILYPVT